MMPKYIKATRTKKVPKPEPGAKLPDHNYFSKKSKQKRNAEFGIGVRKRKNAAARATKSEINRKLGFNK